MSNRLDCSISPIYKELQTMKWLIRLTCLLLLTSCAAVEKKESATVSVQIGVVNHTAKYIYSSSINGASGGNMHAWSAGIAGMCCIEIPSVWHPGLKVQVTWDVPEGIKDVIKEKIIDVEKYDHPGDIYIHFFPNDEIRVVVTNFDPPHPNHPVPYPAKPTTTSVK